MIRQNIPIRERFTNRAWTNYTQYDASDRRIMAAQNHVDIRTFTPDSGEAWTTGTFDYTGTNHLPQLVLTCNTGTTTSASVVVAKPVDLSTGFEDNDTISLSLPSFPLPSVTLASSFIDFTSEPSGNFATGPTASIALNATTTALVNGNSQFTIPRSSLSAINLTKVIGVRFRIVTTANVTVTFAGLRLLNAGLPPIEPAWQYGPVDYDNWNGRLRATVPPNGVSGTPFNQPIMWRSAEPFGADDPRPIDSEFGIIFNTGSQAGNNSITLLEREQTQAFLTQIDLDTTPQSALDGGAQPDLGTSLWSPRTVGDLSRYTVGQLQGQSMQNLTRTPNKVSASWIQFQIQWGATNALTISNSAGNSYNFALPTLTNRTKYVLYCTLTENEASARIYLVNSDYTINPTVIYDTTTIVDDGVFKRRTGRVGWQVQLTDGDAYVESILPRGLTFAEYRSAPLTSLTPVVGAELFASFTPNVQLLSTMAPGPSNTATNSLVDRDTSRSTTGSSYRIQVFGGTHQGFSSNIMSIYNPKETQIEFDLWYPSSALLTGGLAANLWSPVLAPITLAFPKILPDQWQHIVLYPPTGDTVLTGDYYFQIYQPNAVATTYWIDNVSVFERAVKWSGRSTVDDPWKANNAPWTDFKEALNSDNSGVLFSPRGFQLQIRAKALRQDASINGAPKFLPRYAQLGRFVWPDQALTGLTGPTAAIGAPVSGGGRTVTFSSTSTVGAGNIILYEWSFGDGNRSVGPVVTYTYPSSGTYTVTLVVTDRYGQKSRASITETI